MVRPGRRPWRDMNAARIAAATAAPRVWAVCASPERPSEPVMSLASSAPTAIAALRPMPPMAWVVTSVRTVCRWAAATSVVVIIVPESRDEGRRPSARVAQPGGDPVDGQQQGTLEVAVRLLAVGNLADPGQQAGLQRVQRGEVGVAQLECASQDRSGLEQARLPGHREDLVDGALVLLADPGEQAGRVVRNQGAHVAGRDVEVGLGQRHLDIGQERPEERPGPVHLGQGLPPPVLAGGGQTAADAVPAGQDEPRLRPTEDPRDGAQVVEAPGATGTLRRSGADVELAQLVDGG